MGFFDNLSLTLAQWKARVRLDHPVTWKFEVEVEGIRDKGFKECKGLANTLSVVSLRECNSFEECAIPVARASNFVTLAKAVSFDSKMEEWYHKVDSYKRGDPDPRRSVVIRQLYNVPSGVPLLGGKTVELKSWILPEASILELKGPEFDAMDTGGISIQTVKLKTTRVIEVADYGALASLMSLVQQFSI